MQKLYGAEWVARNARLCFRKVFVRKISEACFSAVERRVLGVFWGIAAIQVDLVVLAGLALCGGGSGAAAALPGTRHTLTPLRISKIIIAALQGALLVLVIPVALLTHILVKTIAVALFTEWVTGAAHSFPSQGFQLPLAFWPNPLVEISFRTRLRLMQTLDNLQLFVYDCFVTGFASLRSDIIGGAFTPPNTVAVAVLTLSIGVVILGVGALVHTERTIFHMFADMAVAWPRPGAGQLALLVALHALPVPGGLEEPLLWIAGLHALVEDLEGVAGEAELVAWSPATLWRALLVTHEPLQVALLGGLVVLQQGVVLLALHDPLPVDILSIAEIIVLKDSNAPRPDLP